MTAMETIDEIRHNNVRLLIQRIEAASGKTGTRAGGIAMLAEKLGKSTGQVSHFAAENPIKAIGNQIAREIEEAFRLDRGWMDWWHGDHAGADMLSYSAQKLGSSVPSSIDPEVLSETIRTLREMNRDQHLGLDLVAMIEHDPARFIEAYNLYRDHTNSERSAQQERTLGMKLAWLTRDVTQQGAGAHVRGKKVPTQGTTERGMGKSGKGKR